jgi:hypothetical protein
MAVLVLITIEETVERGASVSCPHVQPGPIVASIIGIHFACISLGKWIGVLLGRVTFRAMMRCLIFFCCTLSFPAMMGFVVILLLC